MNFSVYLGLRQLSLESLDVLPGLLELLLPLLHLGGELLELPLHLLLHLLHLLTRRDLALQGRLLLGPRLKVARPLGLKSQPEFKGYR